MFYFMSDNKEGIAAYYPTSTHIKSNKPSTKNSIRLNPKGRKNSDSVSQRSKSGSVTSKKSVSKGKKGVA